MVKLIVRLMGLPREYSRIRSCARCRSPEVRAFVISSTVAIAASRENSKNTDEAVLHRWLRSIKVSVSLALAILF